MAPKAVLFLIVAMVTVIMTIAGAMADTHILFVESGTNFTDMAYQNASSWNVNDQGQTTDLVIGNANAHGNAVQWNEPVNVGSLGPVTDGEVIITDDSIYVDSSARPDLNTNATLIFRYSPAPLPRVLRDGGSCADCVMRVSGTEVLVDVPGFSNYSLTGRTDFSVQIDPRPELKGKTYLVIDLGNGNRSQEYTCTVQVYAHDATNAWVLVQTNPERAVQAKILGNPDTNQPESLGYFPTKNGMANVYFRKDNIYGYNEYVLVVQCVSPTNSYISELPITPEYSPAGRPAVSSGIWLTSGSNAFYVVAYVVGGLIVLWILVMVIRRSFGR